MQRRVADLGAIEDDAARLKVSPVDRNLLAVLDAILQTLWST